MTPLFDKTNPIQPEELAGYKRALKKTQGNILKSHGRLHTLNVFLTFTGDRRKLKKAIRKLASHVTSAAEQYRQSARRKRTGVESLFVGFGLSVDGYNYLRCDTSGFASKAFLGGMARNDSGLGDLLVTEWERKYQKTLHAMILLAHAVESALDDALIRLVRPFAALADITTEPGAAILNHVGEPVEQFGFVDGISQPVFFQSDIPAPPAGDHWDPGAGTSLVLAEDPLGDSDDDCGSYLVFRKLKQDVPGFKSREADLQSKLPDGPHPELAGAFVVGRFRNGTPVALTPEPQDALKSENTFLYTASTAASSADSEERRCPFSSHIRKVNPRGDTKELEKERIHRIARRGITYGIQGRDANVGLLFQCCQSSLETQFEFLQHDWINPIGKPITDAGTDPVVGQSQGKNQMWPVTWGTRLKLELDFGGFVTLRGGGYFFLPSITFLKKM